MNEDQNSDKLSNSFLGVNMYLDLNDKNSSYIGDGAYAHIDKSGRLWVLTYNGITITNQVCLENDVFDSLVRFYNRRIKDISKDTEPTPSE